MTIQKQSVTYNTYNEPLITFVDEVDMWAEIKPLAGREYWAAKQINSEVTGEIRIRHRVGIEPKMRVKYGTRIFEILSLYDSMEQKKELVLLVKEGL